jgi:TPR repeat protein
MKYIRTMMVVAVLLLATLSAAHAGVSRDVDVDDYRVKAEQGRAYAQYNLTLRYEDGKGVHQDHKEAARLFRKAAGQGHVKAQFNLGLMYVQGQGVKQDYIMAHMYWNIAVVGGNKGALKNRDKVTAMMTTTQIERAQDLAQEWMRTH